MAQIGTREGSLIKERFTKQWEGIRNHLGVLTVGLGAGEEAAVSLGVKGGGRE